MNGLRESLRRPVTSLAMAKSAQFVGATYGIRVTSFVGAFLVSATAGADARGGLAIGLTLAELAGRLAGLGRPESIAANRSGSTAPPQIDLVSMLVTSAALACASAVLWQLSATQALSVLATTAAGSLRLHYRFYALASGRSDHTLHADALSALVVVAAGVAATSLRLDFLVVAAVATAAGTIRLMRPGGLGTSSGHRLSMTPGRFDRHQFGFWTSGISNFVVNRADVLLVAAFLSPASAGVYAIGLSTAAFVRILGISLGQFSLGREAPTDAVVRQQTVRLFVLSAALASAGGLFGAVAFERLLGPEFDGVTEITLVLLVGAIASSTAALNQLHLTHLGEGVRIAALHVPFAVTALAVLPVAGEISGLIGYAAASCGIQVTRAWLTYRAAVTSATRHLERAELRAAVNEGGEHGEVSIR